MEEQEVRNFLRGEGVELTEVAVPVIDINERTLQLIADDIDSEGLEHLIKNLGTISNTFKTENDYTCPTDVIEEGVKLIHTALEKLYNGITAFQGNVKGSLANLDRPTKVTYRRYTAVLFFLIYKSFVEIERAVAAETHNISVMAQQQMTGQKGKRGKRQLVAESDDLKYQFWHLWRPRIVSEILKVVAPPMDEIWEGNLDGYNFFRCITLALCNAIKNKTKRIRAMDPETHEIFDILGVLASKHQEEKGITTRLIPLLKESEETAGIIAEGLARMIQNAPENQQSNMVLGVLTEALDTYMSRLDKDSSAEKGFSSFLTNFAKSHPKGFMHSLAVVVQFLEADSPTVRNAVVVLSQDIMKWTWEQIEEEKKNGEQDLDEERMRDERPNVNNWLNMRQKILDEILLLHCQDVASSVRSKAIQQLKVIIDEKACTIGEELKILQTVRKRLLDKTNYPRKYAAELVTLMVEHHPHMVSSTEAFCRKRQQKLEEIISTIQGDNAEEPAKALYFIIKEFHLQKKSEGFIISPYIKDKIKEADQGSALAFIDELLKEKRYWEACETLHMCITKWPLIWQQFLATLRRRDGDDDPEQHPEQVYLRFFKTSHADVFPEAVDDLELDEINYIAPTKIEDCRMFLEHVMVLFKMKDELDKCQPSLRKLLELGNTQDKKDAVTFFATICRSGYVPPRAVTVSIINALSQLTDEELKDFVEEFKAIFIGRDSGPYGFVKKMLELVEQLPDNLVESLSSTIKQLYSTGSINGEAIKILWDAFSLSTGGWEPSASCGAAHILGIIGQIERKVITSNLNQLIEVGLGERGIGNYELAKVTLQAILLGCRFEQGDDDKSSTTSTNKSKSKSNKRSAGDDIKFPPTHDLFSKIINLIEYGLKEEGHAKMDIMYPRVVELSAQIIYRMCSEPHEVVRKILPNIHGYLFETRTEEAAEVSNPFKTSERLLFRYMSFGKALLGAHITYYEQIVSNEIKTRKSMREQLNKKNKTQNRRRTRPSMSSNSTNITTNGSMNQTNQDAASEMDLVMGHIGFDAEQDRIKGYVAKLLDEGFFRQFRVHVFFLCSANTFKEIKSVNLKIAAVQALAKLALVCEGSVSSSLDVFIQLWQSNETFTVKLEILRASIRLTVKFPNQMEKMNNALTTGLLERNVNVRKACMDYICYLALSDLLKIKDQFHMVAACLVDESFDLREMAKDLINQVAEKDNLLQNCIPDVMSRLSAREEIIQTNYQIIMKTLLQKVKKEKQLGGLVDRIVQRFKGTITVRACQDTIFCLNQIQQNDRTLKVMKDNIQLYSDKLGDPLVWDQFEELLQTFKKLNKPELKMKIEEWEKELVEYHEKCVKLDMAEKAAKRKNEKQKITADESLSDEDEEQQEENGNAEEVEGENANDDGEGDREEEANEDEEIDEDNENENENEPSRNPKTEAESEDEEMEEDD